MVAPNVRRLRREFWRLLIVCSPAPETLTLCHRGCRDGSLSLMFSRRDLGALLAMPLARLSAQGIATRNVKPAARAKLSGPPFAAQFTDIARQAGLREPGICGPVVHKTYVLETVGCGAAFLDYDNDGWLDIFILSGSRMEGAPGATNPL